MALRTCPDTKDSNDFSHPFQKIAGLSLSYFALILFNIGNIGTVTEYHC
jgi:hypothetical protein